MVKIKKSDIHGVGIYPEKTIKAGECIGLAYTLIGMVNGKYIAKWTEDAFTDLGQYHNHSLTPTAKPKIVDDKEVYIYAKEKITPEMEITCNYNEYSKIINIEEPNSDW
jgi:hypothetical protein